MSKQKINIIIHGLSASGLIASVAFLIYGLCSGWFQNEESIRELIGQAGFMGALLFIFIQIIQVVIPIIPGGITSVAGVVLFGITRGFMLNYIGIVIGSILNFYFARKYGKKFVESLVSKKTYNKYIGWLDKGDKYEKFFLFAIIFPCSPDDFLCQLSGLTKMSFKKFVTIIVLFKPVSIFLYSTVLANIFISLPQIL